MPDFKITVTGSRELQRKLRDPQFLRGPVRQFLLKSVILMEANIKKETPVDTGRLRASITHKVEPFRAVVGTNVAYACVVGANHPVYEPLTGNARGIGHYPYETILSKDGTPHRILMRHRTYREAIDAVAIRTRQGRNPLVVTADHLILILREGLVIWQRADSLAESDMVFGKRSHNAVVDGSNKTLFLCFCGTIFWVYTSQVKGPDPKYCSQSCRHRYGPHDLNTGHHWELSEEQRPKHRGEHNSSWRGGTSLHPYDYRFNGQLKQQVKERDGFSCQQCGLPEDLVVHHLDWDKSNSVMDNLITLCRPCHGYLHTQECELPEVDLSLFVPKPILALERVMFQRQGKENIPRLYDFTVENENSFMVGGVLVHNSHVEFGTKPHWPPLAALQPWARRHGFPAGRQGAFLVARAIARRGTRARRMFQKGVEESRVQIMQMWHAVGGQIAMKWKR